MTIIPNPIARPGFCTFPYVPSLAKVLSVSVLSATFLSPDLLAQTMPTTAEQQGTENNLIVEQQGSGAMSAVVTQTGESHYLTAFQDSTNSTVQGITAAQEGFAQNASINQYSEGGIQEVLLRQAGNENLAILEQGNASTQATMDISQDGSFNIFEASQTNSGESTLIASQTGDNHNANVALQGSSYTTIQQEGIQQALFIDRQNSNLSVYQGGLANVTELSIYESDGTNDFIVNVDGDYNTLILNADIQTLSSETPLRVTQTGVSNRADLNYQGVILLTSEINQSGDNNRVAVTVNDGSWITANVNQDGSNNVAEVDLESFRSVRANIGQSGDTGSILVYDTGSEYLEQNVTQGGLGGQVYLSTHSTRGGVINVVQESAAPGNMVDIRLSGGLNGYGGGGATEIVEVVQEDVANAVATISQTNIDDASTRIRQYGSADGNDQLVAGIVQINIGESFDTSYAVIEQTGSGQIANIHQEIYYPANAQIYQSGADHTALIEQVADFARRSAVITQGGVGNMATILQQ